ncbi:hypothetical protein Tco_0468100 [Tanacetum coccineum]
MIKQERISECRYTVTAVCPISTVGCLIWQRFVSLERDIGLLGCLPAIFLVAVASSTRFGPLRFTGFFEALILIAFGEILNPSPISFLVLFFVLDTRLNVDMTDFESWKQRIRLYCKGKDHGEYILQSIGEGPFKMGWCRDEIATGTDGPYLGPERDRVVVDLSQAKKDRLRADICATNILL